jgi:hypothetical protein
MNDHGSGPHSTTKEEEGKTASRQAFEWSDREDEAEEHNQLLQEFRDKEKADLEKGVKQPATTIG